MNHWKRFWVNTKIVHVGIVHRNIYSYNSYTKNNICCENFKKVIKH